MLKIRLSGFNLYLHDQKKINAHYRHQLATLANPYGHTGEYMPPAFYGVQAPHERH